MPHLDELLGVATLAAAGMLGALAAPSIFGADAFDVRAVTPAVTQAAPSPATAPGQG